MNLKTLGKNIEDYRKEAGITQTDLADMCNTTQQQIAKLEKGVNMRIETIERVALAIGMNNPLDLLRGVFTSEET